MKTNGKREKKLRENGKPNELRQNDGGKEKKNQRNTKCQVPHT